jgi:hypothetical protein
VVSLTISPRHRLGWILVEYRELTDKLSTLRGPPRASGIFRIPVLILVWFWPPACGLHPEPACDYQHHCEGPPRKVRRYDLNPWMTTVIPVCLIGVVDEDGALLSGDAVNMYIYPGGRRG